MRLNPVFLLSGILSVAAMVAGCDRGAETTVPTASATGTAAGSATGTPSSPGSGSPVDPYQLLQKAANFLQQIDSYSFTMTSTTTVAQEGMENRTKSTYEVRIERPNRLAIIGVSGANPLTIVSNGKDLIQHVPAFQKYTRSEPLIDFRDTIRGRGPEALRLLGPGTSVIPLGGQRYMESLVDGVVSSKHVGDADVDGTPCHLCEFQQAQMSWTIAIQQGDEPLIRRIEIDFSEQTADDVQYSTKVEYASWDIKAIFDPAEFAFEPPEDATEVASLMETPSSFFEEEWTGEIEIAPIIIPPDAITAAEHGKAIYDFHYRQIVEAFQEVGIHDPEIDERAVEFLDQMAHSIARDGKAESRIEIADRAEALVAEGCEDPLVKMLYAMAIVDVNDGRKPMEELAAIVEESYEGLVSQGYPEYRLLSGATWLWAYHRSIEDPRTGDSLNRVGKHAILTIKDVAQEGSDARVVVARIRELFKSMTIQQREMLYRAAKTVQKQQPWIVNVLGGDIFYAKAWDRRGSGFASEVTPEGELGFNENLVLARERYQAAWEADPSRPEPATSMISVSMAESSLAAMQMWFDRAVSAQADWLPAYHAMLFGMMPRWHGNHQMMYQFGVECMKTERYDTDVPYILLAALWQIQQDQLAPTGNRVWKQPGVYENVRVVTDRYAAKDSMSESQINWWKSSALAAAALSEQWDDANSLVAELGDNIDNEALQRFSLSKERLLASIEQAGTPAP